MQVRRQPAQACFGAGIQPLSMALAKTLILEGRMLQLVPYVLRENKKCPLIITWLGNERQGRAAPQIGSIVTDVNGLPLDQVVVLLREKFIYQ